MLYLSCAVLGKKQQKFFHEVTVICLAAPSVSKAYLAGFSCAVPCAPESALRLICHWIENDYQQGDHPGHA